MRSAWSRPTAWTRAPGTSRGATYLTIGRAMAFVDETGKAAGFTAAGPGLFGVDVLLAAVYGVYMHTVLRMRMTREFNRVIPPCPTSSADCSASTTWRARPCL